MAPVMSGKRRSGFPHSISTPLIRRFAERQLHLLVPSGKLDQSGSRRPIAKSFLKREKVTAVRGDGLLPRDYFPQAVPKFLNLLVV